MAISPRRFTVLFAVSMLVLIGIFAPMLVFNLVTQNQELTVAVAVPHDTSATSQALPEVKEMLQVRHIDVGSVTHRVEQSLRDAGMEGRYEVVDLYRQGQGKPILVIVVIPEPVAQRTDLPEPRGVDVIYVQETSKWRTIPPQVPALDPSSVRTSLRSIMIWPPEREEKNLGMVMINDASGSGSPFVIPGNAQGR